MTLTEYDRGRLAEIVGAVSLAGHAVPAALFAKLLLSLPMEAGGLILGPLIGFPAAIAAVLLVAGAVLLAGRRRGQLPITGLVATCVVDVVLFATASGLRTPLLLAGAVLSGASLALFLSLVRWDLTDRDHTDVVLLVALGVGLMVLATVLPALAG